MRVMINDVFAVVVYGKLGTSRDKDRIETLCLALE